MRVNLRSYSGRACKKQSRRAQQGGHGLGLHGGEHVRIRVEGDPDAGVPQALGDHLRMDSLEQHECGVGVAQVMKADVGEPRIGGKI